MNAAKKGPKVFDLHHANVCLAEDVVRLATEQDEGRPALNLPLFLELLESKLCTVLYDKDAPVGGFNVECSNLARYLWCCLALSGGDKPDGYTFRGMPILD